MENTTVKISEAKLQPFYEITTNKWCIDVQLPKELVVKFEEASKVFLDLNDQIRNHYEKAQKLNNNSKR